METVSDSEHTEARETGLWSLFLSGDRVALGEIATLHYKGLYNYGFRFSQDGAFVRDCLQELFLELWDRREKLSGTLFVKSYLLKALRHKMINESLRFKRFKIHEDLPFSELSERSAEAVIVEKELENQRVQRLKLILSKLTGRQQEIIYLRFYQSMDYAQIAQVMKMEKQSVANLLHRSLKEMREQWFSDEMSLLTMLPALFLSC